MRGQFQHRKKKLHEFDFFEYGDFPYLFFFEYAVLNKEEERRRR
jgi:hypothetical protein